MPIKNAAQASKPRIAMLGQQLHEARGLTKTAVPASTFATSGALGVVCIIYPGRPAVLIVIAVYAGLAAALSFDYAAFFAYGLSLLYVVDRTSFHVPVGILVGVAVLAGSAIAAIGSPTPSRRRFQPIFILALGTSLYTYFEPALTHAGAVASFSLIFIPLGVSLLLSFRRTGSDASQTVNWLIFGIAIGVGRALITAYQHISEDYQGYENIRIFTSGIGSSNYAAALSLVTALMIAFAPVRTRPARVICWASSLPFALGPFIFASRGAISTLGLTFALVFLRAAIKKKSTLLRVFAPIVIVVASISFVAIASSEQFFFWQRFINPTNNSSGYLAGRVDLWRFTLDVINRHALYGTAPGRLTDELLSSLSFAYPHQFFLGVIAQLGVVAGSIYLFAIRPKPLRWSPLAPALIAICINSAVEPVLSTPVGAALGAGLLVAHTIVCEKDVVNV